MIDGLLLSCTGKSLESVLRLVLRRILLLVLRQVWLVVFDLDRCRDDLLLYLCDVLVELSSLHYVMLLALICHVLATFLSKDSLRKHFLVLSCDFLVGRWRRRTTLFLLLLEVVIFLVAQRLCCRITTWW